MRLQNEKCMLISKCIKYQYTELALFYKVNTKILMFSLYCQVIWSFVIFCSKIKKV